MSRLFMFSQRNSNTCSNIDKREFYSHSGENKKLRSCLTTTLLAWLTWGQQCLWDSNKHPIVSWGYLFFFFFLYVPTTNQRIIFKGKFDRMPAFLKKKKAAQWCSSFSVMSFTVKHAAFSNGYLLFDQTVFFCKG